MAIKWDARINSLISWLLSHWAEILCLILLIILIDNIPNVTDEKLVVIVRLAAIISSIFSGILIAYLTAFAIQFRREKKDRFPTIHNLTQQVHNFRRILSILTNHREFWDDDFIRYMDSTYKHLTFFDIQKMTNEVGIIMPKVNKFFDDRRHGDIKQLYLEIKSIKLNLIFDSTLYSDYDEMKYFKTKLVRKWVQYECGNGLWYFFDHRYSVFKNRFNFQIFRDVSHEAAQKFAMKIDPDRFKEFKLRPEHLAKLGSYMHGHVFPALLGCQEKQSEHFPRILKYLYVVLCIILLSGVIFPIFGLMYSVGIKMILISVILSTSSAFYIVLTFFNKLKTSLFE